jgi:hypothetical protein
MENGKRSSAAFQQEPSFFSAKWALSRFPHFSIPFAQLLDGCFVSVVVRQDSLQKILNASEPRASFSYSFPYKQEFKLAGMTFFHFTQFRLGSFEQLFHPLQIIDEETDHNQFTE